VKGRGAAAELPTPSLEPTGGHAPRGGSAAPGLPSAPTPVPSTHRKPGQKGTFPPKNGSGGKSQAPPAPAGAQLEPGWWLAWGWVHPKTQGPPEAAWRGGRQCAGEHPPTRSCLPTPQHRDPRTGGSDGGELDGRGPPILPPPAPSLSHLGRGYSGGHGAREHPGIAAQGSTPRPPGEPQGTGWRWDTGVPGCPVQVSPRSLSTSVELDGLPPPPA